MIRGRARKMGLGYIDQVSLKDARRLAQAKRLIVVHAINPIEERNVRKLAMVAERETEKAKATTSSNALKPTSWPIRPAGKAPSRVANGRRHLKRTPIRSWTVRRR
jgi:hypothetical protein